MSLIRPFLTAIATASADRRRLPSAWPWHGLHEVLRLGRLERGHLSGDAGGFIRAGQPGRRRRCHRRCGRIQRAELRLQGSDLYAQGLGVIDDGRSGRRPDFNRFFRLLGSDDTGRNCCGSGRFHLNSRRLDHRCGDLHLGRFFGRLGGCDNGHGCRGRFDFYRRCGNLFRIIVLFGCDDTGYRGRRNYRRFDFNRRRGSVDRYRVIVPFGCHSTGSDGCRYYRRFNFSRRCLGSRCGSLRRSDLGGGFGRFGCHNAGRNGYRRTDNRGARGRRGDPLLGLSQVGIDLRQEVKQRTEDQKGHEAKAGGEEDRDG